MGREGLEPSRPFSQEILSLQCLPFHHRPLPGSFACGCDDTILTCHHLFVNHLFPGREKSGPYYIRSSSCSRGLCPRRLSSSIIRSGPCFFSIMLVGEIACTICSSTEVVAASSRITRLSATSNSE